MKCYLFQSKQALINKSIFFFWKWVLFFSVCLRGTYKQWATPSECIACPEHSTTDAEGSILKSQCKCHDGYEGDPSRDIACTGNDNSLKKERTHLSLEKKHRFAIWSLHKSVPNRTQRSNVGHARGDQFCTPCSNFPRWISKENCCLAKQAKAK